MEKYVLLGIKKRKSKKSEKEYYVCFLSLETDYDFQIINVMIEEKQVKPLLETVNIKDFDISKYLKLSYNTFLKQYQLSINYGK